MVIGRTGDGDRRIVDSEFIEFQRGKAVPETFVDGAVQWSELKYHRRWRFSLIVHARISLQFDLCRRESMAVVGKKKKERKRKRSRARNRESINHGPLLIEANQNRFTFTKKKTKNRFISPLRY